MIYGIMLGFIGDWLLYIFPLYQGWMELYTYDRFIQRFEKTAKTVPKISPMLWIIPFYKIHREKQRAMLILKQDVSSNQELDEMLSFLDKSVAWFYVALGGLLNAIYATYELTSNLLPNFPIISAGIISLLSFFLGIFHARYRVSEYRKRRMIRKFEHKWQVYK